MIRCPACGRISDGQICLACGHDFSSPDSEKPVVTQVGPVTITSASIEAITDTGVVASAANLGGLSDLSGDGPSVDLLDFDSDDEMNISEAPNQVSEVWGDEPTATVGREGLGFSDNVSNQPVDEAAADEQEEGFSDAETVTDFLLAEGHNAVTETADTQIEGGAKAKVSSVGPSNAINLSARVGALAESMEAEGRLADAATLYEAEKILQKLGH